ncbi:MAG: zinc-binding dehydrogenase [Ilumatobacter sp.]
MSTSMIAAVTLGHGGPDQIEIRDDWSRPEPGPGQALVRVRAAAVNNTDLWSREGRYGTASDPDAISGWKGEPLTFPRIQGLDIAGDVVGVGDGVGEHWVGRCALVDPIARYDGDFPVDIIGSELDGGFAEFHVCSAAQLVDVSTSPLSAVELACLPTAYGTALGMINRAQCRTGERVLVTGSSGGVGSAAMQLLAERGCRVVALTSPSKEDLVRGGGAHEVVVRGVDDLSQVAPVDCVVDVVGGDDFGALVDRLRVGGRLVTAGAIAGPVVQLDMRRLYLQQRRIIGSTMHTPSDFRELARVANDGALQPTVAETFPLAEIHAAQRRFTEKDFVGKLVLEP